MGEPKDVKDFCISCFEHCCPKWKEKKMSVKANLDKFLMACYELVGIKLSALMPFILEHIKDRQATMRLNICEWLKNVAMCKERQESLRDDINDDDFAQALAKCCADTDGKVRAQAQEAMGHFAGCTQLGVFRDAVEGLREKKKAKVIDKIVAEYAALLPPPPAEPVKEPTPPPPKE